MTIDGGSPRNVSASVRQRLLNLARARGEEFNLLLTLYGLEGLLQRLARSPYREEFVLKGAMLLRAWSFDLHRPTRDLDLLGRHEQDSDAVEALFGELWTIPFDDGLELAAETIRSDEIREGQRYGGLRVTMAARLGNARIPIQIDIGFGDAVTPDVLELTYPTLLGSDAPVLLAYPPESVVAEKLHAIVVLGATNTRMKDFYDLWTIARTFRFSGDVLAGAIAATFRRRDTPVPAEEPTGLSAGFAGSEDKQRQWKAFLARTGLEPESPAFERVCRLLRSFLLPALQSLATDRVFRADWPAGGPWRPPS
jgi:predicted nucleotidyltransferase component of viral defense system